MSTSNLFELRGLQKAYGIVRALRWEPASEITLNAGDVLGLAGENGAGKSTLLGAVSGSLKLDQGDMRLDGDTHVPDGPFDALAKGVALIPQETLLSPTLTVAENILLGRESEYTQFGVINPRQRDRLAQAALDAIGVSFPLTSIVSGMPIEHRKMIELARALAANPRVLLVDETSNVLSRDGVITLFNEIASFAAKGGAVIFVTHRLDEIIEHCNQVAIMKDGQLVDQIPVASTSEMGIAQAMVGRELDILAARETAMQRTEDKKPMLEIENFSVEDSDPISFSVYPGEILGIGGLVGCGSDSIIRALAGAQAASWDSFEVLGSAMSGTSVVRRIRSGIAYVPKDRDEEGLLLQASIQDNIVLGSLDTLSAGGVISTNAGAAAVDGLIDRLNIKTPNAHVNVGNLSGGNRQKVLLARWLQRDVPILLLNNPTRGVDIGAKDEIYQLLDQARDAGKAVVVVSDELPELRRLADRVLIMRAGAVSARHEAPIPEENELIKAMI